MARAAIVLSGPNHRLGLIVVRIGETNGDEPARWEEDEAPTEPAHGGYVEPAATRIDREKPHRMEVTSPAPRVDSAV